VAEIDMEWTAQPEENDTVSLYNYSYITLYYDYVNDKCKLVKNAKHPITQELTSRDYYDLELGKLNVFNTSESVNNSSGGIVTLGGIGIRHTGDATSSTKGGALSVAGGASIEKKLYVGDKIALGMEYFLPTESIHVNKTSSTICLENNTVGNFSYIDFVTTNQQNRFSILKSDNLFSLTASSANATPQTANKALSITSDAYIGINTTRNVNSPLTIAKNNFISTDATDGYLGLIAANTNTDSSSNASRIVLCGNGLSSGNLYLSAGGSSGSLVLGTNDTQRLVVNDNGSVSITSTTTTTNSSSGALIVTGGMGINATQNSVNASNGGALTVAGGMSVGKDTYLGKDLHVYGKFYAHGAVSSPVITFNNTIGCSLVSYDDASLIEISDQNTLSFSIAVLPIAGSTNCQVEFVVPNKSTDFDRRSEIVATCNGYTDDDNVIPLFNVLCVGVKNTKRALIKFQSVSTAIHYLTVFARY
jgi:hypothetical protein